MVLLSLLCIPLQAATETSNGNAAFVKKMQADLNRIIDKSGIDKKQLGIWVGFANHENLDEIASLNAEQQFLPASLSKIMTGSAILHKYSLNNKFKTELYYDGKRSGSKVEGNLILKGGGDPAFVSESMWNLVNEFKRSEITDISGDLIVDDNYFDQVRFDENREDSRVDRAYDAPVGAMSFNWNSINIFVRPGPTVGSALQVFADPECPYIQLTNKTVTGSGKEKDLQISRVEGGSKNKDNVVVKGKLGVHMLEQVIYKNITQPDFWSGYQLIEFLRERGITVHGTVKKGSTPTTAVLVADQDSKDLREIVADMLKFSNNYVAEMLTKNLGASFRSPPGTMSKGLDVIQQFLLEDVKLEKKNFQFLNPSGLTRENKFRPIDIAKVLSYVKREFPFYPEFLSALPIAGVDGTLKSRLVSKSTLGWVRAKTGLLTGVAGLAGFAGRKDKIELIFTFIYNGEHSRIGKVHQLFDQLAQATTEDTDGRTK